MCKSLNVAVNKCINWCFVHLLVINSNLGPISYRYWDTAAYWLKSANFSHRLSLSTLVRGDPLLNLWKSFTVPETRVFQAPDGEDMVILACTVFDWSTRVTDRRTELRWLRRTESSSCFRAWKWLQIGTDILHIITIPGDELLRNVNIDDFVWP